MRTFEIIDGARRNAQPCALLTFDEPTDTFGIRISEGVRPERLPFILGELAAQGIREIDSQWSRRWVQERIVPPSRQNLGQVLRANGLDHYDELALLAAAEGRCAQDDFFIREVTPNALEIEYLPSAAQRIGSQLADARRSQGLTQMELAKRAGVDQSIVSHVERGDGNPTLRLLEELAQPLGLELTLVQ